MWVCVTRELDKIEKYQSYSLIVETTVMLVLMHAEDPLSARVKS